MKKVAVIMGSDSDLPVVEAAFPIFEQYGVPFEAHVFSARSDTGDDCSFCFSCQG